MRTTIIVWFAVSAMLAATAAGADETLIVKDLLGPEGPLYVDGNLYYVGWVSNTLSKWDGKTATVLNKLRAAVITAWHSRKKRHSYLHAPTIPAQSWNST